MQWRRGWGWPEPPAGRVKDVLPGTTRLAANTAPSPTASCPPSASTGHRLWSTIGVRCGNGGRGTGPLLDLHSGLDEARFCHPDRPTPPCTPVAHAAQLLSAFGRSPPVAAMSEISPCEVGRRTGVGRAVETHKHNTAVVRMDGQRWKPAREVYVHRVRLISL